MNFFESVHCTSEKQCAACRGTNPNFRRMMLQLDPSLEKEDFECPKGRRWGMQIGDVVAKVATPIAKALKMDCIDKNTMQLKPESPCAKRKRLLNSL
jgi:hypothetical protein